MVSLKSASFMGFIVVINHKVERLGEYDSNQY